MAFDAMVRYPLRTGMMLLATAIGVAAVIMLTGLGEGARRFVTAEFSALGTNLVIVLPGKTETTGGISPAQMFSPGTPRELTAADAMALLRSPSIEAVAPIMIGGVPATYGGLEREVPVIGSTAALLEVRNWSMALGQFLPEGDIDRATTVCVIGAEVRSELFGAEQPVGRWLRLGDRRCRVIGVLGDAGRSIGVDTEKTVFVPVAFAASLFNSDGLFRILINARSRADITSAVNAATRIIKERHYGEEDVTVITQDAVLKTFDEIFLALTMALAAIASVSLLVAGVLIMNVMLVAVSQRTDEIGLLKALGARRQQIIGMFLTEAAMLSAVGALLGTLLAIAAILAAGRAYPDLNFMPPTWAAVAAFVIALGCGLVFSLLPARRAADLDPVQALAKG
jgi:putative ABC transport system permease protein